MSDSSLSSLYHDRFDLTRFESFFDTVEEADLDQTPHVSSPFHIYSVEKLRGKWLAEHSSIDRVPTEILVWGRGEPKHQCSTKVGGIPVWDPDLELPDEKWKFFCQLNLADSYDLFDTPPGEIISVWGSKDFPWGNETIRAYRFDCDNAIPAAEITDRKLNIEGTREVPFFAELYRTWDPVISNEDDRTVPVDHQFESYRNFQPSPWNATKFLGIESLPQWGPPKELGQYIGQFTSIQPTSLQSFPWVNQEEAFELTSSVNGYSNHENSMVIGDMGSLCICSPNPVELTAHFECY